MTREEAIRRLKAHRAELERFGVERLYLFGSVADGRAHDDSDVDLFFDHQKGKIGLYERWTSRKELPPSLAGLPTS